jgi:hypothetical protein
VATVAASTPSSARAPGNVFGGRTASETLATATEIANALAPVILQQGMFANISGKKYPKVEAWTTMGSLVGVMPREVSVVQMVDGSYEAHVELVNVSTGVVLGGASAICGIEEKKWGSVDRYARRSMAVTRATAKAFRLSFSWVMMLAGYQPTPAEEMDGVADRVVAERQPPPRAKAAAGFDPSNRSHQDALLKLMQEKGVDAKHFESIGEAMRGRPSKEMDAVIDAVGAFAP